MEFNIGDVVRIKQGSEHYIYSGSNNPKDMDGVVYEHYVGKIDSNYKYRVRWNNGQTNNYRDFDLVLIKKKDIIKNINFEKENTELKAEIVLLKKKYDDLTYFSNETSKWYEALKKEHQESGKYIAELQRKIHDLTPKVVIEPISEDKVEHKKRKRVL